MSARRIILPALLVLLFVGDIALGGINIPFGEIIQILAGGESSNAAWNSIVLDFRLPKALTCVLAGSALSLSGLQMQTLFRNALAGPDVLGLSSGASLAVSIVFLGNPSILNGLTNSSSWIIVIAASLGSGVIFLIILLVSTRIRDNVSLLIVGLMIGAATSSVVMVLQYVSSSEDLQNFMIWTFGSLGSLDWNELLVLLVVLVTGAGLAFASIKPLNAWLLGDHYAKSIGINIKASRSLVIISSCVLTGGVTAFCGPIAFVGIAVPHLTRILWKTFDHKTLIPAVMAGGAALLLLCDILAQLPGSSVVIPINAVTALIGAPIVIWIIMRNRIA